MPDETYSKAELDQRWQTFTEKNDAWSADILKAIEKNNTDSVERHEEQLERYDTLENKIDPLLKIYDGAGFVKSFFVAGGTVVVSLSAMGAALLYIVHWIRGN